ncbi:MAG: hypothetical protein ABIP37_06915 [Methylotenera sp.]
MQLLRWRYARFAEALGKLGLFALVIYILLLVYVLLVRLPAQNNLKMMELLSHQKVVSKHKPVTASADEYLSSFPKPEKLAEQMKIIFDEVERQQLVLSEVTYRKVIKPSERLERYYIDFSMNAPYAEIRSFLDQVLVSIPSSTIDHISMTQDDAEDGSVHVSAELILFFAQR